MKFMRLVAARHLVYTNAERRRITRPLFDVFYLSKDPDFLKEILRSFSVILSTPLTEKMAKTLEEVQWVEEHVHHKGDRAENNVPAGSLLRASLQNKEERERATIYAPIMRFGTKQKGAKHVFSRYHAAKGAKSDFKETIEMQIHTKTQTFPTPCIVCAHYADHLAGTCTPYRSERCFDNIQLEIPRELL